MHNFKSLENIKKIRWTSVGLPVLFVLAALFYCKLGYIAIVGCKCDSRHLNDLETRLTAIEKEVHGANSPDGIENSLPGLADRLARLENETSNTGIDYIRKEMQTGGATAGGLHKRTNVKDTLKTVVLFILFVVQICLIVWFRHVYRKTKDIELRLADNNDKKKA